MQKSLKSVVVEAGGFNDAIFFNIPFLRPIFMIVILHETLNRRLAPEDSSDFDDFWTEFLAMT